MSLLAVFAVVFAFVRWQGREDREKLIRIDRFQAADVESDVRDSLKRNDPRFLGVLGISIYVPGVANFFEQYTRDDVREIEGTQDAGNEIHFQFQGAACEYALKYNTLILKERRRRERNRGEASPGSNSGSGIQADERD